MAEFLTTTDTSAAIERVIRGAKKELTLISAYVYPRVIYLQRLKDAAERGVSITFIFGKRRMDEKVFALFKEIPNLKIYYLEELHAKCFVNEREAIVTSLNLLNGSEEKNREMGVRLDRGKDTEAYNECVNEVRSILREARLVRSNEAKPAAKASGSPGGPEVEKPRDGSVVRGGNAVVAQKELPESGHCIRCGKTVPCNPDAPLCYEDFTVWVKYEDPKFIEKVCHTCGRSAFVSMADPMCNPCNQKYASELKKLTVARRKLGELARRSWRKGA